MPVGWRNSDLSRIDHFTNFVEVRCRICGYYEGKTTKPRAIRLARAHVGTSGHEVTLFIHHFQVVRPKD